MLTTQARNRRGATLPTFAAVLPLILMFAAFAINLAYIQLCRTQMRVAVDAAAHAGGRRMGTPPRDSQGKIQYEPAAEARAAVMETARSIAAMNVVAGKPAVLADSDMEFGRSKRETVAGTNRLGPYEWYETITSTDRIPSSFRVVGAQNRVPLIFGPVSGYGVKPKNTFDIKGNSTSTQVDRDIVLVLDRSGSMIYFEDEDGLDDELDALRYATYETGGEDEYEYRVIYSYDGSTWYYSNRFSGYYTESEYESVVVPYDQSRNDLEYQLYERSRRVREANSETLRKISDGEYDDATDGLYDRWYSDNLVYWLERDNNEDHQLGDVPADWTEGLNEDQARAKLTVPAAIYCYEYSHYYKINRKNIDWDEDIDDRRAPTFSRWYYLDRGVSVFLNVLGGGVDPDGTSRDGTVQKEQVGFLPFNASPDTINAYYGGTNYQDNHPDFDYGLQNDGFPTAYVNESGEPGYNVPYSGTSLSLRTMLPTVCPYGGTAIGSSLREAVHILRNQADENDTGARARPFAAKTIVVLTDGDNTVGDDPVTVARDELGDHHVQVQTITFTTGVSSAGKTAMGDVADYGRGRHYHTNNGADLGGIFEEIANNLPTIWTR